MEQTPVWSWRDAVRKADIAPLTKLVCYTLANYMSDVGEGCFPSIKTLMADTGLSNRSLATHLDKAAEAGLLEIRRKAKNGRCNVYLPRFPERAKLADQPALDLGDRHVNEAHVNEAHVKDVHVTSERGSRRQVNEVHTNSPRNSPSNKQGANGACPGDAEGDNPGVEPSPPDKRKKGKAAKRPQYTQSFEAFWKAYPQKRGKADAAKAWADLTEEDREAAKSAIPAYIADCKENRRPYRYGSTYLNQRTWDDYGENDEPEPSVDEEKLVQLVVNYGKDQSTWGPRLQEKLGPPPGQKGCTIPEWIVAKARQILKSERQSVNGAFAAA